MSRDSGKTARGFRPTRGLDPLEPDADITDIQARLHELEPAVEESQRLQRALEAL